MSPYHHLHPDWSYLDGLRAAEEDAYYYHSPVSEAELGNAGNLHSVNGKQDEKSACTHDQPMLPEDRETTP